MKNKTYVKSVAKAKAATVTDALKQLLEGPDRARLFGYAMGLCHDRKQSEELIQEACYRALKAGGRYDLRLPLVDWVAVILRNAYFSSLRCARPESLDAPALDKDGEISVPRWALHSDGSLPMPDQLEQHDRRAVVLRAVASLSQNHQEVIVRCYVRRQPMDEAARALGISLGTVKSRLSRGRAKLRRALGGLQ